MEDLVIEYLRDVGINDAYGEWRATMGMEFVLGRLVPAEDGTNSSSLHAIVEKERTDREKGRQHNLSGIWMVIEGDQDAVESCAEWVKQECSAVGEIVYDFVTTDDANGDFLDGSLSLFLPAPWAPSGAAAFLHDLVSRYPQLRFDGSALEFRNGEPEPRSGCKFVGFGGKLRSYPRRFDHHSSAAALV